MNKSKGSGISSLLVAALLIATAFLPAVSGNEIKNQYTSEDAISVDEVLVQDPDLLTEKARELINDVLRDGKVTVEELKMLIDRNLKIVVSEDPEEVSKRHSDYDLILLYKPKVQNGVEELMAKKYKEEHGYIPEEIGIRPDNVTEEELRKMIREGKVDIRDAPPVSTNSFEPPGDPNNPPYQGNGRIYVDIYPAKDSAHAPADGANWNDVNSATIPFENEFGVDMVQSAYYNIWDASDVGDNIYDLLDDLVEDISNQAINVVIMGWVDNADHNGVAQKDGYYSVCVEVPDFPMANWPDDSVAQHELSHNFDAQDAQESGGNCTDECIMDYWDAFWGTDNWCPYHWNIVNAGVWG